MGTQTTEKRLFRAREDAYVGGVCAGIAAYYDLDAIVVRILAILIAGLTLGLGCLAYIGLWARLPLEPESTAPYDVTPESAESNAFGCVDCASGSSFQSDDPVSSLPLVARLAVAAGLMLLFLAVAINVSPLVPGTRWWQFWPLGLLMAGLCLIIIPIRTRFETAWHALGIALTSLSAAVLPMSLGIMSWHTVVNSLQLLWPIAVLAVVLAIAGFVRKTDVLVLAASFCVVAYCLMALTFCVVPGQIEVFLLQNPAGHPLRISFVN